MAMAEPLRELCERFGVANLYVFGSRARAAAAKLRGDPDAAATSTSDLDIGITPLPNVRLDARRRVQLAVALEDLFATARVDLVVLPEADPFVALEVVRGELLYCANANEQAEEELYVLRRAGDLAPLKRERMALILTGEAR